MLIEVLKYSHVFLESYNEAFIFCHVFVVLQGLETADPYEEAVIALPLAVKERLLRILRLGIATRFDVSISCCQRLVFGNEV